ncbi:hypothetical protein, partial [Burkholderia pseudomallei]|uniref:hypothetical protein n=1 Tax=Burkholderia pseudomallei TaxID=28450 RepID=UPI001E52AF8A
MTISDLGNASLQVLSCEQFADFRPAEDHFADCIDVVPLTRADSAFFDDSSELLVVRREPTAAPRTKIYMRVARHEWLNPSARRAFMLQRHAVNWTYQN